MSAPDRTDLWLPTAVTGDEFVGPYRVIRKAGSGGMGIVYLAVDKDERPVAVKVLRDHVADDADARARLRREMITMRRVRDRYIADVIDADLEAERPYIVSEFVDGPQLDDYVDEVGPLSREGLITLGRGLLSALTAIHSVGVVHRDLKPGNVLLEGHRPVVIDFGIAQLADETRLTMTGLFVGTPGYVAPETIYGDPATPATDWWAWASVLAYAATGTSPAGKGPIEVVLDRIRRGELRLDAVDADLRPLLQDCLAVEPRERPDVEEIRRRFDRYAAGSSTGPARAAAAPLAAPAHANTESSGGRGPGRAGVAAGALAAAAGAGGALWAAGAAGSPTGDRAPGVQGASATTGGSAQTVAPQSGAPPSVAPRTVAPRTVAPRTVAPQNVSPQSVPQAQDAPPATAVLPQASAQTSSRAQPRGTSASDQRPAADQQPAADQRPAPELRRKERPQTAPRPARRAQARTTAPPTRRAAGLPIFAFAVLLIASAMSMPVGAGLLVLLLLGAARTIDGFTAGVRWREEIGASHRRALLRQAFGTPWAALKAGVVSVGTLLLPAAIAAGVAFGANKLVPAYLGPSGYAGNISVGLGATLGLLMLWFGPGSSGTRTAVHRSLRSLAPTQQSVLALTAVLLIAAAAIALVVYRFPVLDWWPLPGSPGRGLG